MCNFSNSSVWRAFKATGDQAARNQLMEAYLPAVRYAADRIGEKLPHSVDVQDLMSAGIFALLRLGGALAGDGGGESNA